jgi:hypothetical protein
MRKILIGVSDNVAKNIDKILIWKKSFELVTKGDVILLAFNCNENDRKVLEQYNISYKNVSEKGSESVNNSRLIHVSSLLRDLNDSYDGVIYSDVFDVAFMKDPFLQMDFYNYGVFVAGEGITHNQEPWNTDVMQKCFPDYTETLRHKEVFCSGVIGGKPFELSQYIDSMWLQLLKNKKGHDIADQAAMNIVLHTEDNPLLKKFYLYDKWAIHLATGGPTEFFEPWGFKKAIQDKYNLVPNWKDFAIVHQFNRTPEIHNLIKKIYA